MEKMHTARSYSASPFLIQSVACCWHPIYPSNQQSPHPQLKKKERKQAGMGEKKRREIKDMTTLSQSSLVPGPSRAVLLGSVFPRESCSPEHIRVDQFRQARAYGPQG